MVQNKITKIILVQYPERNGDGSQRLIVNHLDLEKRSTRQRSTVKTDKQLRSSCNLFYVERLVVLSYLGAWRRVFVPINRFVLYGCVLVESRVPEGHVRLSESLFISIDLVKCYNRLWPTCHPLL